MNIHNPFKETQRKNNSSVSWSRQDCDIFLSREIIHNGLDPDNGSNDTANDTYSGDCQGVSQYMDNAKMV